MPKHFKTKVQELLDTKLVDITKQLDKALQKEQGSRIIALAAMGMLARTLKEELKTL